MKAHKRGTKKMPWWFREMGDDFRWDYERMFHKGDGMCTRIFQEEAGLEHVEAEGKDWAEEAQGQRRHIPRDFRECGRQPDLARLSQGYKTEQHGWKDRLTPDSQEHWMVSWEIHASFCWQHIKGAIGVSWVREKGRHPRVLPWTYDSGSCVGRRQSHTWKMPRTDLAPRAMFNKRYFPLSEKAMMQQWPWDMWEESGSEQRCQRRQNPSSSETGKKEEETRMQRKVEIRNTNVQGSSIRWPTFSMSQVALC